MITRISIATTVTLFACGSLFGSAKPIYVLTPRQARQQLEELARQRFAEIRADAPERRALKALPRAAAGDCQALRTVFATVRHHELHTDYDGYAGVPWLLLHAAGDQRFTACLQTMPQPQRRIVLRQLVDIRTSEPRRLEEFNRYFARRFPRAFALVRIRTSAKKSNQAMPRTASSPRRVPPLADKAATNALRVSHPHFGCEACCTGLAVADLGSR